MDANLIYYIDKSRGEKNVRTVKSSTLASLEKMRGDFDQSARKPDDENQKIFVGAVISSKVVAAKKSFGSNGVETNRRADRILIVYDALNNFGHCAAIVFETGELSRKGLHFLSDRRPLNGTRVLLTNVEFKGVSGIDCLAGDSDLPILVFEAIYPLQEHRSLWMLQNTVPMNLASDSSITRAITYKSVFLRVKNIQLKKANCSGIFCDRSLCYNSMNDTEVKCMCFPSMFALGGRLALSMDIEMYRERVVLTGVVCGEESAVVFHPFQSLEWSKFLLGPNIQSTNSNVEEWECGIINIRKFVETRVNLINLQGGWNLFGWYKNGMVDNKVEVSGVAAGSSTAGKGAPSSFADKKRKDSQSHGKFGSLTAKPHIVRIVPAVNKKYWLQGDGAEGLVQYTYKADAIDATEEVTTEVAKDEIIDGCPF